MHGFGVKLNAFKIGAEFYTSDSAAWGIPAANQNLSYLTVDDSGDIVFTRVPEESAIIRKVEGFKSYYTYSTKVRTGEYQAPIDERLEFAYRYENGGMSEGDYLRWIDW